MQSRYISVRKLGADAIPRGRYATHGVDSYPAKMVPHLARYAIQAVSRVGDTVYDPFCGCGTVIVESLILGRNAIGCDINPIAVLLARAKSATVRIEHLAELADDVVAVAQRRDGGVHGYPRWLSYWFTPAVLQGLSDLATAIRRVRQRGPYATVLLAALALAVRRVSRADPRSPKPFISKEARRVRLGRFFDPVVHYRAVIEELCQAYADFSQRLPHEPPVVSVNLRDARKMDRGLCVDQVDGVVTSPPYLTAQDYYRSSKLEMAICGFWRHGIEAELGPNIIGSGRGTPTHDGELVLPWEPRALKRVGDKSERAKQVIEAYMKDMSRVVGNVHDYLRPGGKCCLIIGDSTIQGIKLPVHSWVCSIAESQGFCLEGHDVDLIAGRRVPPQREGHRSIIDREHLLFFRKSAC